ncbi:MAG TPA: GH116 family glycosyl hydrolase [bacterium]|nr:GH116 family glycosyl hydrolase [bacterium]
MNGDEHTGGSLSSTGPAGATAGGTGTLARAYRIAVRDLRACYNPDGIVAGRLKFNAYWARDGLWAVFGALALGDAPQARAELEMFARYQPPSGSIPVRVEFVGHHFSGYNTLRTRPRVVGRAGGLFRDPVDTAALFVLAVNEYLVFTGELAVCAGLLPAADRALGWLGTQDRDRDGLLETHYLADWMDSIMKRNRVFNINVMYYAGLRAFAAVAHATGEEAAAARAAAAADAVRARLVAVFWSGDYFFDWVHGRRHGGFSSDGNIAAMFFGAATEDQARRILAHIASRELDVDTPLRTCDPVYPWWQVYPMYYLAGIPDYHRTCVWPWLGTLNAINKARLGDRAAAVRDLERIGGWYVRSGAVNEVYLPTGMPVSRRFYSSEVPFAWNAAFYVYALRVLGLAPADSPRAAMTRTP